MCGGVELVGVARMPELQVVTVEGEDSNDGDNTLSVSWIFKRAIVESSATVAQCAVPAFIAAWMACVASLSRCSANCAAAAAKAQAWARVATSLHGFSTRGKSIDIGEWGHGEKKSSQVDIGVL